MTRRRLLQAFSLIVLACAALLLFWRPRQLRPVAARLLKPRVDASSPVGALSEGELQNLVAFGEVLVEGRTLSAAERGHLIEHLDDRARGAAGYLSLYRMTASLLDRLAGSRFAGLDLRARAHVMAGHRLTSSRVSALEFLWPFRREERAVRVLAVPDIIQGYYRSAAGWAVVGYRTFPGRPSDLIRYTLPEA